MRCCVVRFCGGEGGGRKGARKDDRKVRKDGEKKERKKEAATLFQQLVSQDNDPGCGSS